MPNLRDAQSEPLAVLVVLAVVAVVMVLVGVVSARSRRRREAASLHAIEFVRGALTGRLARGDPIEELLDQVVQALRDSLKLDKAEVWSFDSGALRLAASEPPREAATILITEAEASIAANATICGNAWAKVWLPPLLEDRQDVPIRIAPLGVSGQLLGLIVIERAQGGFPEAADLTLMELGREMAAGLNKQRLDAALHASLEQLRRQAEELQASRARIVAAADVERRRMERDLHDGAQQHLVTIAVKARLIEQLARKDPERSAALADELTADVEAALEDLRTLSHGLYPPLLNNEGLGEALRAAARHTSIPVHVDAKAVGRYQPELEAAVYYCCLEAMQNAAKHAGDGARAAVRAWEESGELRFEVSDEGGGFDVGEHGLGAGLTNMSDRMSAVGGSLRIESAPGAGTRVRGAVPLG